MTTWRLSFSNYESRRRWWCHEIIFSGLFSICCGYIWSWWRIKFQISLPCSLVIERKGRTQKKVYPSWSWILE
jgi:hypothetical protein